MVCSITFSPPPPDFSVVRHEKCQEEKRKATAEVEPTSGAVVQAFTTGTVVQVFLLSGNSPTEAWSGNEPGNKS